MQVWTLGLVLLLAGQVIAQARGSARYQPQSQSYEEEQEDGRLESRGRNAESNRTGRRLENNRQEPSSFRSRQEARHPPSRHSEARAPPRRDEELVRHQPTYPEEPVRHQPKYPEEPRNDRSRHPPRFDSAEVAPKPTPRTRSFERGPFRTSEEESTERVYLSRNNNPRQPQRTRNEEPRFKSREESEERPRRPIPTRPSQRFPQRQEVPGSSPAPERPNSNTRHRFQPQNNPPTPAQPIERPRAPRPRPQPVSEESLEILQADSLGAPTRQAFRPRQHVQAAAKPVLDLRTPSRGSATQARGSAKGPTLSTKGDKDDVEDDDNYPAVYKQLKKQGRAPQEILTPAAHDKERNEIFNTKERIDVSPIAPTITVSSLSQEEIEPIASPKIATQRFDGNHRRPFAPSLRPIPKLNTPPNVEERDDRFGKSGRNGVRFGSTRNQERFDSRAEGSRAKDIRVEQLVTPAYPKERKEKVSLPKLKQLGGQEEQTFSRREPITPKTPIQEDVTIPSREEPKIEPNLRPAIRNGIAYPKRKENINKYAEQLSSEELSGRRSSTRPLFPRRNDKIERNDNSPSKETSDEIKNLQKLSRNDERTSSEVAYKKKVEPTFEQGNFNEVPIIDESQEEKKSSRNNITPKDSVYSWIIEQENKQTTERTKFVPQKKFNARLADRDSSEEKGSKPRYELYQRNKSNILSRKLSPTSEPEENKASDEEVSLATKYFNRPRPTYLPKKAPGGKLGPTPLSSIPRFRARKAAENNTQIKKNKFEDSSEDSKEQKRRESFIQKIPNKYKPSTTSVKSAIARRTAGTTEGYTEINSSLEVTTESTSSEEQSGEEDETSTESTSGEEESSEEQKDEDTTEKNEEKSVEESNEKEDEEKTTEEPEKEEGRSNNDEDENDNDDADEDASEENDEDSNDSKEDEKPDDESEENKTEDKSDEENKAEDNEVEKSEDKEEEKSEDNDEEKSEDNEEEKSEDKADEEKSEDKDDENKSEAKEEEKSEDNENEEESKTDSNEEEKSEDKDDEEEKSDDNEEEKSGDSEEEKSGDSEEEKSDDDSEDKDEEKTEDNENDSEENKDQEVAEKEEETTEAEQETTEAPTESNDEESKTKGDEENETNDDEENETKDDEGNETKDDEENETKDDEENETKDDEENETKDDEENETKDDEENETKDDEENETKDDEENETKDDEEKEESEGRSNDEESSSDDNAGTTETPEKGSEESGEESEESEEKSGEDKSDEDSSKEGEESSEESSEEKSDEDSTREELEDDNNKSEEDADSTTEKEETTESQGGDAVSATEKPDVTTTTEKKEEESDNEVEEPVGPRFGGESEENDDKTTTTTEETPMKKTSTKKPTFEKPTSISPPFIVTPEVAITPPSFRTTPSPPTSTFSWGGGCCSSIIIITPGTPTGTPGGTPTITAVSQSDLYNSVKDLADRIKSGAYGGVTTPLPSPNIIPGTYFASTTPSPSPNSIPTRKLNPTKLANSRFVYALTPDNRVIRKIIYTTQAPKDVPFLIYGQLPNGTLTRRFPNGSYVPDEMTEANEVIGVIPDPKYTREHLEYLIQRDKSQVFLNSERYLSSSTAAPRQVTGTARMGKSQSVIQKITPGSNTLTTTSTEKSDGVDVRFGGDGTTPMDSMSTTVEGDVMTTEALTTTTTTQASTTTATTARTTKKKKKSGRKSSRKSSKKNKTSTTTTTTTVATTTTEATTTTTTEATTTPSTTTTTEATTTPTTTTTEPTTTTTEPTTTTTQATTTPSTTTTEATTTTTEAPVETTKAKKSEKVTATTPTTRKSSKKISAKISASSTTRRPKSKSKKNKTTTTTTTTEATTTTTTEATTTTASGFVATTATPIVATRDPIKQDISSTVDPEVRNRLSDIELLNNLLKNEGASTVDLPNEDLAEKVIQLAIEKAHKGKTIAPPFDNIQALASTTATVSTTKKLAEAGGDKGGKISVWVVPPDGSTTKKNTLSDSEVERLNYILTSSPSTIENLSPSEQLILADLVSSTARPDSRGAKQAQNSPFLQALFPQGRPALLGGSNWRNPNYGPADQAHSQSENIEEESGLVTAAINITKAVSQFMSYVLQGAVQNFQSYVSTRTQALARYLSSTPARPN